MNFKHFDWTDKKVLCVGLNTFDFSLKGDGSASPKSKLAEVNLSCLAVVWKSTWKKLIKIFPPSSNLVSVSSIFTDFITMEFSGKEKSLNCIIHKQNSAKPSQYDELFSNWNFTCKIRQIASFIS